MSEVLFDIQEIANEYARKCHLSARMVFTELADMSFISIPLNRPVEESLRLMIERIKREHLELKTISLEKRNFLLYLAHRIEFHLLHNKLINANKEFFYKDISKLHLLVRLR